MTLPQTLIQLPNKDLWRGCVIADAEVPTADAELIPEAAQNPINRAMAAVLKASAGARELTCIWCGLQGNEKYMREHLNESHKSVIQPASAAEAALAQLARQQKSSIEAEANKE